MADDLLELEGVRLLSTAAELTALCAARGWGHNIKPGVPLATLLLDVPVDQVLCTFEADRLVQMQVTYRDPDPARVAAAQRGFKHVNHVDLLGMWGALSADLAVARMGDDAGGQITAVAVRAMSNKAEVGRIFQTFGGGLAPPA